MVEPVDPFEGGELDRFEVAPGAAPTNHLGLGACKEFCVCEPYDELLERRDVWQGRKTTGFRGSYWTS